MSHHISDLGGLGEIIRQVRLGLMGAAHFRSRRLFRALQDEALRLKNEEQALKNRERKLKYVKDLLALAKAYDQPAEEIQAFVSLTTGKRYSPLSETSDSNYGLQSNGIEKQSDFGSTIQESAKKSLTLK